MNEPWRRHTDSPLSVDSAEPTRTDKQRREKGLLSLPSLQNQRRRNYGSKLLALGWISIYWQSNIVRAAAQLVPS